MANIAFDIDGTITDYHGFVKSKVNEFTEKTGMSCSYFKNVYGGIVFNERGAENKFWEMYAEEYLSLPILPEARAAITALQKAHHRIYFISARTNTGWGRDYDTSFDISIRTLHWLADQGVFYDGMVCTLGACKVHWLELWNVDSMIEDWAFPTSSFPHCSMYQLDKAYNRNHNFGTRVRSLNEFCQRMLRQYP